MASDYAGRSLAQLPLAWSRSGLPIGIHFGAALGREDILFRLAAQLEQARPWIGKKPPL